MYYIKLCCIFILWKHYGSLRHLYLSYETSKIKHLYDSIDAILPTHHCRDTARNGRSPLFSFFMSIMSEKTNRNIEKVIMLSHCQTDVSFLGAAFFGYLNSNNNSYRTTDTDTHTDTHIDTRYTDNIDTDNFRSKLHQYLLQNKIYHMMMGGSYVGNISETVHLEISTGINTLLLNVRNRKNEIDFLVKQIQLEINHIIALVVSYLYFCLWSFQFIFFFFNFTSFKKRPENDFVVGVDRVDIVRRFFGLLALGHGFSPLQLGFHGRVAGSSS
jgi:hypothetical protein